MPAATAAANNVDLPRMPLQALANSRDVLPWVYAEEKLSAVNPIYRRARPKYQTRAALLIQCVLRCHRHQGELQRSEQMSRSKIRGSGEASLKNSS